MPSNYGPTRVLSLVNAITDETTGIPFDCTGYTTITAYITGTGTTSSGVIKFEEADYDLETEPAYLGTWSSISDTNASDVSGGAQKAVHFTVSAYHFLRPRITTAIGGGGSISVTFVASASA